MLLSPLQLRGPARDKAAFRRPPLLQSQHSGDDDQKNASPTIQVQHSIAESGFGLVALNKALIS